ncbi:MAG: transposase [Bacteroidota bacterium]
MLYTTEWRGSVQAFLSVLCFFRGCLLPSDRPALDIPDSAKCFLDSPRQPLYVQIDDATRKKNGRCIEGVAYYCNGAGTARQEYRSLRGLNWIWATMLVPLKQWPNHHLCIPVGLQLYLKKPVDEQLKQPYYSRSALARQLVDRLARGVPGRSIIVSVDGGYATKEFLRALPDKVVVTGRFPIASKLYQLPEPPPKGKREAKPRGGRPRKAL